VLPYTIVAVLALTLLSAADIGVFQGWGHRIDASVLPYLPHLREVWASAGAVPRGLLLALWLALAAAGVALVRRVLPPRLNALPEVGAAAAVPLALATALLFVPARGGWQLIPVNQSSAYFSPRRFANQAALNPGWNFFDTWRRGLDRRSNPYVAMPADSAARLLAAARPRSTRPERDTALLKLERPNLLLIVWESLPARAVAPLGGLGGVTPELAALAQHGLLFRRFYAAGDHTEKGLAALLSGTPSIPNASLLRVPSKATTLPMLSRNLAEAGYHSAFYYGGELAFGGLQSFLREAGIEHTVAKAEFPRSSWTSKWGAHDEAVASRLLSELDRFPAPFFATWLTLSSHEPFEVPGPARIPGSGTEARFLNSLAYTDHVIGTLLRAAQQQPWWSRTLVVIVADHSKLLPSTDRAAPYKSAESWYHIPMLWTGGALARTGVSDALGGQTDLAPTLLGRLGLRGGESYRFGRDLFATAPNPFAFYGFDEGFGLVTERGSFVWDRAARGLTSSNGSVDPADVDLGKAMLQLAYQDYLDR
jgi:phosphoglycerol transferase MdoB-like AlkP superfamily enzyme